MEILKTVDEIFRFVVSLERNIEIALAASFLGIDPRMLEGAVKEAEKSGEAG
ncbi:MAG: hypothetical protein UW78_C0013G0002 [Candidatus Azambacteria bacterium GW2011_GWA1_44_9]|uniref:Uncharacterized protein n=1 Tax=Candidatus Azambacteria bacterium GW2011_GWA1_44_9 TaxID=1618610 RepID=A0A0G1KCI4_9BACT|nr:MAG: hypothetical protein UW78_C0013G0002 [Candidatus Azambacteria bacterium GW2011_GWA1_44_9]